MSLVDTRLRNLNSGLRSDEARFDLNEIFFSRTDKRGVIQAGNEVFRRISEYDWDGLLGAPHKVIRHPEMPKGVFHLMWERILAGKPTGAYVKNNSKSGKHYWVYAIVSPIETGFVSVRIKPTSELFAHIPQIYAELLKAEQDEGITPEESANRLLKTLAEHGYEDYEAFNADSVGKEVYARDDGLKLKQDSRLAAMRKILPLLQELSKLQNDLFTAFASIKGIPSNMRIVASRLEPAGGPISAISQNYRLMADEVTGEIDKLRRALGEEDGATSITSGALDTLFAVATSRVQREVSETFSKDIETGVEEEEFQSEVRELEQLTEKYSQDAGDKLLTICGDLERIVRSAKDLRQLVTGLDSIRVLCRVEAGRLGPRSSSLLPVIDQLDRSHVQVDKNLEQILDISDKISELAEFAMPRKLTGTVR